MAYGRQAYAACDPSPAPPTFVCSGANATGQAITANNANVSTVPGFSVNAPVGDGVNIAGNGDIRFTDNNVSTIESAAGNGLFVISTGDDGTIAGAVTITTNGDISGLLNGINGQNFGSGDLAITANGDVTGTDGDGIFARNSSDGVSLTIAAGAGSAIAGYDNGINGLNLGSGDLAITANGEVTGTNGAGIAGYNSSAGVDLTIATGPGSAITGYDNGIDGLNLGSGDLSVTANGEVTGTNGAGIIANNSSGGVDLTIATGAGSAVTGNSSGIDGQNFGGGDLTIIANGDVNGTTGDGIAGYNSSGGVNLTVTTGAGSAVTGNLAGIRGVHFGSGDLAITANGEVTGTNGAGIVANNSSAGVNLTVATGTGSAVTGNSNGLDGRNLGTGDLAITANGEVNGTTGDGIRAYNSPDSVNLSVATGTGSAVTGGADGINGSNFGSGFLDITANGEVTGDSEDGIFAYNSEDSTSLTITTGAASVITGANDGIDAENYGSGDLTITANGRVTGYDYAGIDAYNSADGGKLTVTTGAGSVIRGVQYGIYAENEGEDGVVITANGEVTGENGAGIEVANSGDGKLTITTGARSVVTGGAHGIDTDNHGYGDLEITANGIVTGLDGDGIYAGSFSGGDNLKGIKVTTGAASIVTGSENGIYAINFGDLDVEITVNGVVTGEGAYGIHSRNGGDEDTIITIGAGGLVQGNIAGIDASSRSGQDIFITNDGLVRNLSGESDDRAIATTGGPTTIDNNNRLIGTVFLGEFEDTLNNAGRWDIEGGVNDFGGSYDGDTVNNSGTIVAAGDGTVSTLTIIDNLEQFNNSGLVSLVDGGDGDTLNLAALPGPIAYVGNNGELAVDAFLADGPAGESDVLDIAGTSAGTTTVIVNLTNPLGSTPNFDGIEVIRVSDGTAEEHFNLEGGVLNAGFFAWDLVLDGDAHELVTVGLGAGSFEFAAGTTGAQDFWYQTTGTLLQRQADLRALLAGTQVTPVADFSEPVEPTPVAHVTPGLWLKGVGAYIERDRDEDNNVLTDRKQEIYGVLAGFDFGSQSAGEAWLFGLFGGWLHSTLDFDQTGTEWQYEGPSIGAYATYLNDAVYADVTVKADFLDVDIDADDIAPGDGDAETDALNIGGQIDTGYKVGLDRGLFVEPQASLAVVHTEIDDIDDIFGGAVDFDDETSVRGRLGLRLGHEMTAGNRIIYSSDVTASIWQEFAGDNDVTIFAPLTPATDVSDSPVETFGDVSLGFSMLSPEGWSSFLRANYQFAGDYDAFAGNAGVRYAW